MSEPIVIGEGGESRNRRVIILAGAAVVLILAIFVLPGLLFGGGGGSEDPFATAPTTPGATPTTASPTESIPETFETFSDKNPFVPLVATNPGGAPETTDTTLPPETVITVPDDGSVIIIEDGDGTEGTTDGSTGGGEGETTTTTVPPRQPDRVSLLEVYRDQDERTTASVRVNDITYLVKPGDSFATSYRVLSLDIRTRCGQFLYGDERFALCEGDEVLK
jgi:hypothetical protein